MNEEKLNIYITACIKLNNKINFVHAKQSLIAISVTNAKQFSEHINSFKYRSRQAVTHAET